MLIYFSACLFSQTERFFNAHLAQRLETQGFTVFLPQRDGVEKDKPPYNAMTQEERRKAIFELEKQQIFACDIFLFLLDGRVSNERTDIELDLVLFQSALLTAGRKWYPGTVRKSMVLPA